MVPSNVRVYDDKVCTSTEKLSLISNLSMSILKSQRRFDSYRPKPAAGHCLTVSHGEQLNLDGVFISIMFLTDYLNGVCKSSHRYMHDIIITFFY